MEVHRIQEHDRLPECFRPNCWTEAFTDKNLFKWTVLSEGRRGEYSAYYRIGAEWVDDGIRGDTPHEATEITACGMVGGRVWGGNVPYFMF